MEETPEFRILNHFCNIDPILAVKTMIRFPVPMAEETFRQLNSKSQVAVLKRMPPYFAVQVLAQISLETQADLLEGLPLMYITPILRQFPKEKVDDLLQEFSRTNRQALENLLNYQKDQAGALADPGVALLRDHMTAEEALQAIRQGAPQLTYYQYVGNEQNQLTGVLSLKTLLGMSPNHQIAALVHRKVIALKGNTRKDTIINFPAWKLYPDLPVVDRDNAFIGVLRYRSIRLLQENLDVELEPLRATPVIEAVGELNSMGLLSLLEGFVTILPEYGNRPSQKDSR